MNMQQKKQLWENSVKDIQLVRQLSCWTIVEIIMQDRCEKCLIITRLKLNMKFPPAKAKENKDLWCVADNFIVLLAPISEVVRLDARRQRSWGKTQSYYYRQ